MEGGMEGEGKKGSDVWFFHEPTWQTNPRRSAATRPQWINYVAKLCKRICKAQWKNGGILTAILSQWPNKMSSATVWNRLQLCDCNIDLSARAYCRIAAQNRVHQTQVQNVDNLRVRLKMREWKCDKRISLTTDILLFSLLTDFHALWLLHFSSLRSAPAFSTFALFTPAFSAPPQPEKPMARIYKCIGYIYDLRMWTVWQRAWNQRKAKYQPGWIIIAK